MMRIVKAFKSEKVSEIVTLGPESASGAVSV